MTVLTFRAPMYRAPGTFDTIRRWVKSLPSTLAEKTIGRHLNCIFGTTDTNTNIVQAHFSLPHSSSSKKNFTAIIKPENRTCPTFRCAPKRDPSLRMFGHNWNRFQTRLRMNTSRKYFLPSSHHILRKKARIVLQAAKGKGQKRKGERESGGLRWLQVCRTILLHYFQA